MAQLTRLPAAAMLVAAMMLGCAQHSALMIPATRTDDVPSATVAKVIFIRHADGDDLSLVTIVDENGKFLGDVERRSHFTATLPAGDHTLIGVGTALSAEGRSWKRAVGAAQASLVAGRVYFVDVGVVYSPDAGGWDVRIVRIAPGETSRIELATWMRETRPLTPDVERGQRTTSADEDLMDRVRAAKTRLSSYAGKELETHRILGDDGLGATAAASAAPAEAPQPTPAAPAPGGSTGDDTVFLKNGGRVRGSVMVDDPEGVTIQLSDRTKRVVKRGDVERVEYAK